MYHLNENSYSWNSSKNISEMFTVSIGRSMKYKRCIAKENVISHTCYRMKAIQKNISSCLIFRVAFNQVKNESADELHK